MRPHKTLVFLVFFSSFAKKLKSTILCGIVIKNLKKENSYRENCKKNAVNACNFRKSVL